MFKGACPDHSWNNILACLHSNLDVCLLNLSDGSAGSIDIMCSYHGDFCHALAAACFSFAWNTCQTADLLCGNIFRNCVGNFWFGLDLCLAAALASLLASSFPSMSMCPGVHCTSSFISWSPTAAASGIDPIGDVLAVLIECVTVMADVLLTPIGIVLFTYCSSLISSRPTVTDS